MEQHGEARPSGELSLRVIRGGQQLADRVSNIGDLPAWPADHALNLAEIGLHGMPQRDLPAAVNEWRKQNQSNLRRGMRRILLARSLHIPHFYGQLFLTKIKGDGEIISLGLASLRLVTTAGVRFICDDFNNNTTDVTNMKFHGFGTGTTAEAVTDTALVTEETTQYVVDNTRPTGSQASATVSANATYTTVATYSPDSGATRAITEHGIFSQAATGGGTLLDRSVFSVVNLVAASDSLQATYVFTVNSGG
jgi:hypothetical protein